MVILVVCLLAVLAIILFTVGMQLLVWLLRGIFFLLILLWQRRA